MNKDQTNLVQEESCAPLAVGQQRLWVLEQIDPGNTAYHVWSAWRLEGSLHVSELQKATTALSQRHAVLRSGISAVEGQPQQCEVSDATMSLEVVKTDREALNQRILAAIAQPFNLSQPPLVRALLFQLSPTEAVLLLVAHRIVADEASLQMLWEDACALCVGQTNLPAPTRQFPQFAVWQKQWMQSAVYQRQLAYWKGQLEGAALLELPLDRPRPAIQTKRGNAIPFTFPASFTDKLRSFADAHEAELSTVLLAGLQALLARYTDRSDILVGVPVENRDNPEWGKVVGPFSNHVVFRTDFSTEPYFSAVTRKVSQVARGAFAHQELPFEALIEHLHTAREQSYHPVFQVEFDCRQTAPSIPQLPGVRVSAHEIEAGTCFCDLRVFAEIEEGNLRGCFRYSTDLFEASTVERMIVHWQNLLEAAIQSPGESIWHLQYLTHEEEHTLLVQLNATGTETLPAQCIHHLFEAQVQRTPDAIAAVAVGEKLTYRQLNNRAEAIAGRLRQLGARPEKLVGICLTRRLDLLAGILGILKAGSAYVPLDPAYPADRIEYILGDAKIKVLLTEKAFKEQFAKLDAEVVCLDEFSGSEQTEASSVTVSPTNLCYVIYTSGSTGRPKGVALEHHNAVNFILWAQTVFSAGELKGVLASTSICFDLSVFEMFVPLSAGGTVVMADNALDITRLSAVTEITLINTVPSAIAELLRLKAIPASVSTINLAGEPLAQILVEKIYEVRTVSKVYDLYGPSETTVYSTFALRQPGQPATVGRPVANTQIFILDSNQQLVPQGIPGELYIGGEGVARGYLNQPELTAQKFLGNPFSSKPDVRLYRTGDRARYFPNGNIEFLGRIDNQVKIRGFRIELGEIETVLRQHPNVADAVVMAREDIPGEKRLAAYIVAKGIEAKDGEAAAIPSAQLRQWLRAKVPEYMVPSAFVFLNALPLTPNGKVDRKRLPTPQNNRVEFELNYVPPSTTGEEVLAQIWSEVLGVQRIGVHDNFFELGGHSLLITQIIARIQETMQVELPMKLFFDSPTIAEVAQVLENMLLAEIDGLSDEEAHRLANKPELETRSLSL